MLPFLRKANRSGVIGVEVRADGIALAFPDSTRASGILPVNRCIYRSCSAAERSTVLEELVSEHKLGGMTCRLVLPPDQYQTYPIEKPQVDESEVADAARWRVKDLLDFDLEDAVTDVYEFPQDALRGRPDQLNVVACRKTIIRGLVELVTSAGLEPHSIDVADLALRNLAAQIAEEETMPVALLYLRNGAGLMVLVKGMTLYLARHFDFSLNALNEPSQQDSVMQHLALEIQRSFDYFESQLGQIPPASLTLVGPDPSIPLSNMLGGTIAARVESFEVERCMGEDSTIDLDEINAFVALGAAARAEEA